MSQLDILPALIGEACRASGQGCPSRFARERMLARLGQSGPDAALNYAVAVSSGATQRDEDAAAGRSRRKRQTK